MVTVIQKAPGNAFTDILGALNTVLSTIEANRRAGLRPRAAAPLRLVGPGYAAHSSGDSAVPPSVAHVPLGAVPPQGTPSGAWG
jgi:hypothetical protein